MVSASSFPFLLRSLLLVPTLIIVSNCYPTWLYNIFFTIIPMILDLCHFETENTFEENTSHRIFQLTHPIKSTRTRNEFNSLFPRSPPLPFPERFLSEGVHSTKGIHIASRGGWRGMEGPVWSGGGSRWSASRWFKTLERPPRPRVPFTTAAPGPCKKGAKRRTGVGFVPRKIRSRGNTACATRRGRREREVGVERGKEAVNEDAKARSARAQK